MTTSLKDHADYNLFSGSRKVLIVYLILQLYFLSTSTTFSQNISQEMALEKLDCLRKSKADTARVNILQSLSQYLIYKGGEDVIDLDSAIVLARLANSLSKELGYPKGVGQSILLNAMAHREKGERDKGKVFAQSAIDYATKQKDYLLLGESLRELSQYYSIYVSKEEIEKMKIVEQMAEAFSKTSNLKKQADALQDLADMNTLNSEWPTAIQNITKCLKLYEAIDYPRRQEAYRLLSYCLVGIGVYDEALKNGHLALKIANQLGDSNVGLVSIYYQLGMTYGIIPNYDSALLYLKKAYYLSDRLHDAERLYVSGRQIRNTLMKQNKPEEALTFLRDLSQKYPVPDKLQFQIFSKFSMLYALLGTQRYKEVDQAMKEAVAILDRSDLSVEARVIILTDCVNAYVKLKKFNQARSYLNQLDKIAPKNITEKRVTFEEFAFKIDSAQGNYRSAFKHLQLHIAMKDSINKRMKENQLKNLKLYYQAAQKDRDVQIQEQSITLLKNQNELQQNALIQLDLKQRVTLGGVLILLIISGLLYYLFRAKKAASKKIQEKNKLLERLVTEKEWLLKEVHHRVKNNLQTVVSLLESQSALLEDDALAAMQDCQNRVFAMSLIHQRLYQSENIESIDMNAYVNELVSYLRNIFGTGGRIQFKIIIDSVRLDITQAIPIGLILNEAITNSLKYAFPPNYTSCHIIVDIQIKNDHFVNLLISDNGIGFKNESNKNGKTSLGMRLMRGLTEDLSGSITISSLNGTRVEITFPLHDFTHHDKTFEMTSVFW